MASRKKGWAAKWKKDPAGAHEALRAAIFADQYLFMAVQLGGLRWCRDRLREIEKNGGKVDMIIDIVFPGPEKESK